MPSLTPFLPGFACSFAIFQIPPRRSVHQKRPSSQALEALAGSDSAPARRRRATGQNPSTSLEPVPLWCYGEWPDSWHHHNIVYLEFYPIVLSLHLWGHEMQNRRVVLYRQ